jgi:acyl transferase domain-containing protein
MTSSRDDSLPSDAIAIIGMAGRFPGARNIEEFWSNLVNARESIRFFSPDELDPAVRHLAGDSSYVPAKGVLDDIELFDASFFGIFPAEARMLDPQQRVLLELAWTALEDAGYADENGRAKTGVFVGTNWNRYFRTNISRNKAALQAYGEFNALLANEADFPATRISYKLNLTGPSISLYTACSTGLVAVAEAAKSLLHYECDLALAGGASIVLPQRQGYIYQEGGMLSSDGHTRSFDAAASGTTFNEGAALVVLKRLEDAVADHDQIYAVIRGCAVNNDGGGKMSFTAPSVVGQTEVIATALATADVEPDTVTLIEAHGTATPVGDPIEVEALSRVYERSERAGPESCVLGSVKSNIGHAIHAAGVAGLIKVALAAKHGLIPGTLHFSSPNPELKLENTRFKVTAETTPWRRVDGAPRRGGVSSFGVGGTNCHVIVEEPPRMPDSDESTTAPIVLLSARDEDGLSSLADAVAETLASQPGTKLGDVAYSLAVGRKFHEKRLAVVASDRAQMVNALRARRGPGVILGKASRQPPRIAFAFPGQGSQRLGMGASLYASSAAFRKAIDECFAVADSELERDLRELTVDATSDPAKQHLIEQTRFTQPALFAISYALARHVESLGVRPDVMIGHSVGEFVAATVAGVMSMDQGMRLIIERGRLMQSMPPGGMLAVALAEAETEEICRTYGLSVSAINAPDLTVLSGEIRDVERAEESLTQRDVRCRRLKTSHAFHSPMMDPAVKEFGQFVSGMKLSSPDVRIVSTATGALLTDSEARSPSYWQSHLRAPVRFADGLGTLLASGPCAVLELGPGSTLTGLALRQTEGDHCFAATLDKPEIPEAEGVLLGLARMWADGASIPWSEVFRGETRSRVTVPTYPFKKERHWIDPDDSHEPVHDLKTSLDAGSPGEREILIEAQLELMKKQLDLLARLK